MQQMGTRMRMRMPMPMRMRWSNRVSRWTIGLLFGMLTVAAQPPQAAAQGAAKPAKPAKQQDKRKAAKAAYDKAEAAYTNGDYATALESFKTADDLIPTPQTQYWIARSLDGLDRNAEAITAYRTFLDNPSVEKAGTEKIDSAKQRLAALEAQEAAASAPPEEPPAEVPAEPPPPPPETVSAPTMEPPIAAPRRDRHKPRAGMVELGVFGGALVVSRAHNLHEERFARQAYERPAWLAGGRIAFFPHAMLGLEAEYAHGWGKLEETSTSADFNIGRGHLIIQAPTRLSPFALLGAGVLHATSDQGSDADFLAQAGAGLKYAVTPSITPRLDVRVDATQRQGGGFAFSPEALLGLSFVLGR
jgi:tetratricopeptide (TPR) repeat protein